MRKRTDHPYYPFDSSYYNNHPTMVVTTHDQIERVKELNIEQCQAALNNKQLCLKKTVLKAIESRIRKLQRKST